MYDVGHRLVEMEAENAGLRESEGEDAVRDEEDPRSAKLRARAQTAVLGPLEIPFRDREHEADGQVVLDVARAVERVVVDEVAPPLLVETDRLGLLLRDRVDHLIRAPQIVQHDRIGDVVHLHHAFVLAIRDARLAHDVPERAGLVEVLDVLGGCLDRLEEHEEVVAPPVALLMVEHEIHEALLEFHPSPPGKIV